VDTKVNRQTRAAMAIVGVIGASVIGVGLWQGMRWRAERDAQCASAMPLVDAGAEIAVVRNLPVGRPVEYSGSQADTLIRAFGAESDKAHSVRRHLHRNRTALLFHENNSIMLVYFDERLRAVHAECFLQ